MTLLEHMLVYFFSLAATILFALYTYRYGNLNHEYNSWAKRKRQKYGMSAVLFFAITALLNIANFSLP